MQGILAGAFRPGHWLVLLAETRKETFVEWYDSREDAQRAVDEFEKDARDSGAPVETVILAPLRALDETRNEAWNEAIETCRSEVARSYMPDGRRPHDVLDAIADRIAALARKTENK